MMKMGIGAKLQLRPDAIPVTNQLEYTLSFVLSLTTKTPE